MNQYQLLMMNHQSQMKMINQNQQIPLINQPPPLMNHMNQQPPLMSQSQLGIYICHGIKLHQHTAKLKSNSKYKPYLKPNFSGNNWKGRKCTRNGKIGGRSDHNTIVAKPVTNNVFGYELGSQPPFKPRKLHPEKRFNKNNRLAPCAPRNTTSFIIRAKKSGGIASLISPCPVTPAVLPTPVFSPLREVLGDMAKEEWGVDGYGSMKGLIRRRNESEMNEDEDKDGWLSRFEMIYPNEEDNNNLLENRVDDTDTHIAQLEEDNFTLKERLFVMERDLGDLRRRLQCLENQNQNQNMFDANNEPVVENGSNIESGNDEEVLKNVARDEGSCTADAVVSEGNDEEVVQCMTGNDENNVETSDDFC